MTAFEIVLHQRDSVDAGGREYPPETVHVGPDVYDAPWDLENVAAVVAARCGLHVRRLTRRFAYLSDGECFISLYVREEKA